MIRLKELYAEMHSTQRRAPLNPSPTYDETLWGNMYAIRELPATIKVRSKASTGSTANYVSLKLHYNRSLIVKHSEDGTSIL